MTINLNLFSNKSLMTTKIFHMKQALKKRD